MTTLALTPDAIRLCALVDADVGGVYDPSPGLGLTWALPEMPLPRPRPFPAGDHTAAPPIAVGLIVVVGPYYVVAADIWCAGAVAGEVGSS